MILDLKIDTFENLYTFQNDDNICFDYSISLSNSIQSSQNLKRIQNKFAYEIRRKLPDKNETLRVDFNQLK